MNERIEGRIGLQVRYNRLKTETISFVKRRRKERRKDVPGRLITGNTIAFAAFPGFDERRFFYRMKRIRWMGGAGLISNTNRNKSTREFASILPFSSSNWQNRKIIPRVWSVDGEVRGKSLEKTWFFNVRKKRKYGRRNLAILLYPNSTFSLSLSISIDSIWLKTCC